MYYRVPSQADPLPTRQCRSTGLSSLDALFRFLRLYCALLQDRLRMFSSTREATDETRAQVNKGLGSNSVTAPQFLQERPS
jgi:hypothetical protein